MLGEEFQGSGTAIAQPETDRRTTMARPDEEQGGGDPKRLGGLVLTRRVGQSLMVGDEVEVEVVNLKPGAVSLRIVAPRHVAVHRQEVFEAIRSNPRSVAPRPASNRRINPAGQPQGGLVLTRQPGQAIMIGDQVVIEVDEIRASAIRLRINAPREVMVHRREVFEAIRRAEAGGDR